MEHKPVKYKKNKIVIECPKEIEKFIIGAKLICMEILEGDDAYCADKEILMDFSNGKEMRIYIDEDGDLRVYTD